MPSLRERRHREAKDALSRAAFELFESQGFADTTMEQIAQRAGVSRSTAYRRFASKEDIVYDVPRGWLRVWDEAVNSLPPSATAAEALEFGASAVAADIDGAASLVQAAQRAFNQSPVFQSTTIATVAWIERVAALVIQRSPQTDQFDANTIAGAYLGAIDTMMRTWGDATDMTSVLTATNRVLERLAPILD